MKPDDAEILLAGGDTANAAMVRRVLRQLGFVRVHNAADGYTALVILKKIPLSLMIVDWNLPKLDGNRLIQEMRKIPRFRSPRIIMITNRVTRDSLEQAVDLGIDEYLLKPFTAKALHEKLETTLEMEPS
jgi:two-component system chemotaxis response regulator CheY